MDRVKEEEKGKSKRPEMGSKGKEEGVGLMRESCKEVTKRHAC